MNISPRVFSVSPLILFLVSLIFIILSFAIFSLTQENRKLVKQLNIVPDTDITIPPSPKTGKLQTSCQYNGKTYKNGDSFQNDCNSCSCDNGQIACTLMACE